ncbi:hypothetical protein [Myroides odoratus]|uniref:KTSC domain-containing protein n=1 Tax=Myroides odoratus TaxID=256 RepID=A0A9Q7E9Y4_MYROD|nr:hypothetical protein [Myroides odoratus]EHQ44474.1 hypothetical protein Myrod_3677 [Myroides odoratus DSM 2801]EKB03658.1 hypothetical protein HMPREF9716_03487 [Myroides odoratus CIP 103059]QQU01742.1 hypothetical protein I6I88_08385 [Myroides odoratus]WQD55975.1 hypothetical protein U0010_10600 [Myroides odoratus]STZ31813.1 Uncharacterised protein [Myroides odoratus]
MKKILVLFTLLFLLSGGTMLAFTITQQTTEAVEKSFDPTQPYGYTITFVERATGIIVYEETFCAIEVELPAIYERIFEPFGDDVLDDYEVRIKGNGPCNY